MGSKIATCIVFLLAKEAYSFTIHPERRLQRILIASCYKVMKEPTGFELQFYLIVFILQ